MQLEKKMSDEEVIQELIQSNPTLYTGAGSDSPTVPWP